jgi:hypothetical protein
MTDDETLIREAPRELLELAVATRPDWDRDDAWSALLAARAAGWPWTRTVHETVQLMLMPDGEPAGLRHAARPPMARTDPGTLAADLKAKALAACERASETWKTQTRSEDPAEDALGEVIRVLAETCEQARQRGKRGVSRMARRTVRAEPERAAAVALAKAVIAGDLAGAGRVLSAKRTPAQWRDLALLLASSADPEFLAFGALEGAEPEAA